MVLHALFLIAAVEALLPVSASAAVHQIRLGESTNLTVGNAVVVSDGQTNSLVSCVGPLGTEYFHSTRYLTADQVSMRTCLEGDIERGVLRATVASLNTELDEQCRGKRYPVCRPFGQVEVRWNPNYEKCFVHAVYEGRN